MKYYKIQELKQGKTMRFDLKEYDLKTLRRMICYYGGKEVFETKKRGSFLFLSRRIK